MESEGFESEGFESEAFRAIMRQQAGAVALICTGTPGQRFGLTATAVCPLTDSPPTILTCVNRNASAHDTIKSSNQFSVNLLGDAHMKLAGIFAGQTDLNGEDRFNVDGYTWSTFASGMPRLGGAIATIDCAVTEHRQFSSHTLFVGEVREGDHDETLRPLLYFRGQFGKLAK